MPLVSITNEMKRAQAGHYAVPLFGFFELTAIEGIMDAISEKKAPAILGLYTYLVDEGCIEAYAGFIRKMAERVPAPVSLMLDHGTSFEQCMRAIKYGFTDVMFDGSKLPLDENIAVTKLVVRAAHAAGVGVEAELGHVGSGQDYSVFGSRKQGFTDPAEAGRFVKETGVDILAVAFGSAHGVYQGKPELDLEVLKKIRSSIDTPLVLHGGSGLSDAQFLAAIDAGIAKINIATDLVQASTCRMVKASSCENAAYPEIIKGVKEAHKERSAFYLDLFRASGKAA